MILSVAIWRIYPSWVNDKLWAWEGLGHSGMFWARLSRDDFLSKLEIISFPSRVMSVSKSFFFVSCAFEWFGAKCSSSGAFGFGNVLGLFLKTPLRHRAFFTNSYYDHKYFLEIPFFFKKQRRFYLPDSYGDPKSEQSTLVMVRRKPEWNPTSGRWRDRAQQDHRSSSRLVQVVCDDPWSWREKKKHKEISVWFAQSTNQRVLRSLFPRRDVATVSHFAIFMDVDGTAGRTVRLQRGDSEEKQSSVTFPVLITEA